MGFCDVECGVAGGVFVTKGPEGELYGWGTENNTVLYTASVFI